MIWRIYYEKRGAHVHCRVFSGVREGALGKLGDLVMTVDDFWEFSVIRATLPVDFRNETDPKTGEMRGDHAGVHFRSVGRPDDPRLA